MSNNDLVGFAILPAQSPPPFPDPILLPARRVAGSVLTPPEDSQESKLPAAAEGPALHRRQSMMGNILQIDGGNEGKKSFLLQRKLKTTVFGTVRVGYLLDKESRDGLWQVALNSEAQPQELVAVTIEDKAQVLNGSHSNTVQDPKTELSALQLVSAFDPQGEGHVDGASILASDERYVYTITPFHKEGSLLEYCAAVGHLSEKDALFFFKQILHGLVTLRRVEICHRDLSLEKVYLRGTKCTLVGLNCALRIPTHQGYPHMLESQPPCASNPQFLAPELLKNDPFDGYAVDLWSAGVMLLAMLLGLDFLFVAPVLEDRRFKEICIDGDLRRVLGNRKLKSNARWPTVSDAAVDLLQNMLRADIRNRLSLSQVFQHPWLAAVDEGDQLAPKVRSRAFGMLETYR